MIVFLVLLIAALAVGGLLATLIARDPGYVLVSYDGATLETSLWFAATVLLVAGLIIYAIVLVVRRLTRSGSAVSNWARSRRATKARNGSVRGLMLLAEGRWREATQALLASEDHVDTPLFNHLAAARAANEVGRFEERDAILDRAREATPQAAFAVGLVRAELQQAAGQWRLSTRTLKPLQQQAPRHPLVLKRLFDAHKALGDWDAVAELAQPQRSGGSGPKNDDADGVQAAIWRARIAKSQASADAADHARGTWKAMPKKLRADEALVLDYVEAMAADAPAEAEAALRRALKTQWREAWVRRYGTIMANPAKQLAHAMAWSKHKPEDADLLLTLGRLAVATGDSGKGREYLEAGLAQKKDAETLEELAALCAGEGDSAAANDYLREALALARRR